MEDVSEFGNAEMNIYAIAPTARGQEPAHSLMQIAGTIKIKINLELHIGVCEAFYVPQASISLLVHIVLCFQKL